ncbi:MAG: F420-0:Gamma-glutamyl ligase, partial [Veillonella sp.]|nr:F420-0:Gamma-glutamyl ligase [Veillonella sp.]
MSELQLVPVHTRILTESDDIVEAILEYGGDQ